MASYYGSQGLGTTSGAAEAAAAEEARKARIRAEISCKQGEIANLRQQIKKLKDELNDLHIIKNNRSSARDKIEADLYERRHRIEFLESIDGICLCSRRYKEGMREELHSAEAANLRCEIDDMFIRAQNEMRKREDEIADLERKIRNLEEQIESLRSQL